jgi:transketolase
MYSKEKQNLSLQKLSNCIKVLSADAVEKANSGHPGMPLGFSQVMTSLIVEFLKFNPHDPKWFNRDRLVLSAGHGSMLLYSFFYLAGYKNFSINDVKNFRQLHSKAAGHPERHLFEAIETTTGPLGQGFAASVGMAIAEKKYQTELGTEICDHKIYAIVGDGCLMEGVSYEAASLAGHLKLNNLIVLFDDNGITIDGRTDLAVSENHVQKFQAFGFNAVSIDGNDCDQIRAALKEAQNSDKPSFIACKTTIGKGSLSKENSEKSHGSPLGKEEISHLKQHLGFKDEPFYIDPELKTQWEEVWKKSENEYNLWQDNFRKLSDTKKSYITSGEELKIPDLSAGIGAEATRVSSGKIIEALMSKNKKIICGSADLAGSNNLKNSSYKAISAKDFSGNFIHYGVRENAMSAIMNGLALSGFIPVGGTFFVFSDYMRPSIRLSALMNLQVIYVMTHDSIGVGEDGPTHQPIEHLASLRAMPNIDIFRPADFTETKECYELALANKDRPSMIVLSRQSLPQIRKNSEENLTVKGGYIISEASDPNNIDVTIFASGSEVNLALEVQKHLQKSNSVKKPQFPSDIEFSVRVCSVPSTDLLYRQPKEYLQKLQGKTHLLVAIEAASSFGWTKIIGRDGLFFGIDEFGASAPAEDLFRHFGLSAQKISEEISEKLQLLTFGAVPESH